MLYKYTSAATAKIVLETGMLRWSSPLKFNDPFDVPRSLELPFTASELQEAVASRMESYVDGTAVAAASTVFALLGTLKGEEQHRRHLMKSIIRDSLPTLSIPIEIAIAQFREAWLEKVRHLRVLCFSAVGDSATMWAHYAANHRGAVLQFESNDERDSASLLATPVVYRPERPGLPLVDRWARAFLQEEELDWNDYFRECYYVKTEDWRYEQEYRAISASLDGPELHLDQPFFREDLRGVVLGMDISPQDEQDIRRLAAAYPHAVLYRAHLDHSTRKVSQAVAP